MVFTYNKFLKTLGPYDRFITILDNDGNQIYTINPFDVYEAKIFDKYLKISLRNDQILSLEFSSLNEVKLALPLFNAQVDSIKTGSPYVEIKQVRRFSYDKFLRELAPNDRNIQVLDDDGIPVYTINPYAVIHALVNNNLLEVALRGGERILIPFSSNYEAKLALERFQIQLDILRQRLPYNIDKEIENYIEGKLIELGIYSSTYGITIRGRTHSSPDIIFNIQNDLQQDVFTVTSEGDTTVNNLNIQSIGATSGLSNFLVIDDNGDVYYQTAGIQGFQGVQGYQGNQGWQGFQGFQGQDGYIGEDGPQGFQGFQGRQGWQGYQGPSGSINFTVEVLGITGSQGYQGFQGRQGFQGNQGPSGSISFTVEVLGITGSQGYQGYQGWQGNQGFQGWQGNQGFQGWQGNQGLQGRQGFQGFQGNQGVSGSVTFTFEVIGITGPQGYQGMQGWQGWQGFQGFQGMQGWQGNQGFQGMQGFQGWQGNQGFQGMQGWQGFQGNQGFQGWQGWQGYQGFQGWQGNQGFQGWQGATGTFIGYTIHRISGSFSGASMSANPTYYYDIIFPASFTLSYVVNIESDAVRTFTVTNKTLSGFRIESNSITPINDIIYWDAKDLTSGEFGALQGLQGPAGYGTGGTGSGLQGYQGWQGSIGLQGLTGADGLVGEQGFQGITGIGLQGFQGITGVDGLQGWQGITGFQGVIGLQGFQGITGVDGLQGWQGTTGSQGNQGLIGLQGPDSGFQGSQGLQGVTGLDGTQGWQGITGSQGYQGLIGLQGPTGGGGGAEGTQGFQGFQGAQGFQGVQGFQGITGSGFNSILEPASGRILTATGSSTTSAVALSNFTYDGSTLTLTASNFQVTNGQSWNTFKSNGNTTASVTINLNNGNVQSYNLNANTTFSFSNGMAGATYVILVTQGASSFTASFASAKWSGNIPPIITTTNGAVDIFTFIYDGSFYYGSYLQNY